jgi:prolyl-tRNA synthetase
MRQSQLFGKTEKTDRTDATLASHKLLVKGGFIRESVAGRYFFLPLGLRVQNKIIEIARKEMNKKGAQEMVTPILHPLELWQETNRDNAGNFGLMLVEDRRGAKFALGGTAEEMFVDVVRKFQLSYKDLPFNIYQFSNKFRDELRARGGLLRVREFIMKDGYSFDTDADAFVKTYSDMSEAYRTIFERMGLSANRVLADNGYIGGEYCHEYIVDCEAGESRYLVTEDGDYMAHEDVAETLLEPMNADEEIQDMITISQPEWVQTMEDNLKHYGEPKWRFLKNVVYKRTDTGEIIIVTIRGDLEVNKTKLEKVLHAIELLDDATDEDLASLGTKSGFVHSWGHSATYVADESLKTVRNFIGGQKENETDTRYVNYGRDFKHAIEADVSLAQAGQKNLDGKVLLERKGVEVGNIFQLGTHYTNKMSGASFQDREGEMKPYYMGCYGIGIGRTMATVIETHHDEKGMIWPWEIAPYHMHLVALNTEDAEVRDYADGLYNIFVESGIEVLYDDRTDARAGEKFADSDLIGIPYRVVVSRKSKDEDRFEVVQRQSGEVKRMNEEEIKDYFLNNSDWHQYS